MLSFLPHPLCLCPYLVDSLDFGAELHPLGDPSKAVIFADHMVKHICLSSQSHTLTVMVCPVSISGEKVIKAAARFPETTYQEDLQLPIKLSSSHSICFYTVSSVLNSNNTPNCKL